MKKILSILFSTAVIIALILFFHENLQTETIIQAPKAPLQAATISTDEHQIEDVLEKHRENVRLAENNWHPVSPFNQ